MQKKLTLVLCSALVLLSGCSTSPREAAPAPLPQRVLFIGNSYTRFNNLPQLFHDIAASTGRAPAEIKAATPNGMTLRQHLHSPDTVKLIDEGNWDIVILQAQSQGAAKSEQDPVVRAQFLEGAAGIYDRIKSRSPGAQIIFYETWARHADYWKEAGADRSVGRSPAEMQARIRKWDQAAMGRSKDFILAPVGEAWELNYKSSQPVRLHDEDNSHPAFPGSYLAALVLYGTIYHPPNLKVSCEGELSRPEARYLQGIATEATHRNCPR